MRKRELKRIAYAIAQNETVLEDRDASADDKKKAMASIMKVSGRFESLEDMATVDEMVQDLLATRS